MDDTGRSAPLIVSRRNLKSIHTKEVETFEDGSSRHCVS
jgi:hypothetical protein